MYLQSPLLLKIKTRGMCAPLLVSWTTSTSTMTLDVYEMCITTAGVIFVKSDYDVHDYIRCGFRQVPLRICQGRLCSAMRQVPLPTTPDIYENVYNYLRVYHYFHDDP